MTIGVEFNGRTPNLAFKFVDGRNKQSVKSRARLLIFRPFNFLMLDTIFDEEKEARY